MYFGLGYLSWGLAWSWDYQLLAYIDEIGVDEPVSNGDGLYGGIEARCYAPDGITWLDYVFGDGGRSWDSLCSTWNFQNLADVNEIGVGKVVYPYKFLHCGPEPVSYGFQGIAPLYRIIYEPLWGLRGRRRLGYLRSNSGLRWLRGDLRL